MMRRNPHQKCQEASSRTPGGINPTNPLTVFPNLNKHVQLLRPIMENPVHPNTGIDSVIHIYQINHPAWGDYFAVCVPEATKLVPGAGGIGPNPAGVQDADAFFITNTKGGAKSAGGLTLCTDGFTLTDAALGTNFVHWKSASTWSITGGQGQIHVRLMASYECRPQPHGNNLSYIRSQAWNPNWGGHCVPSLSNLAGLLRGREVSEEEIAIFENIPFDQPPFSSTFVLPSYKDTPDLMVQDAAPPAEEGEEQAAAPPPHENAEVRADLDALRYHKVTTMAVHDLAALQDPVNRASLGAIRGTLRTVSIPGTETVDLVNSELFPLFSDPTNAPHVDTLVILGSNEDTLTAVLASNLCQDQNSRLRNIMIAGGGATAKGNFQCSLDVEMSDLVSNPATAPRVPIKWIAGGIQTTPYGDPIKPLPCRCEFDLRHLPAVGPKQGSDLIVSLEVGGASLGSIQCREDLFSALSAAVRRGGVPQPPQHGGGGGGGGAGAGGGHQRAILVSLDPAHGPTQFSVGRVEDFLEDIHAACQHNPQLLQQLVDKANGPDPCWWCPAFSSFTLRCLNIEQKKRHFILADLLILARLLEMPILAAFCRYSLVVESYTEGFATTGKNVPLLRLEEL